MGKLSVITGEKRKNQALAVYIYMLQNPKTDLKDALEKFDMSSYFYNRWIGECEEELQELNQSLIYLNRIEESQLIAIRIKAINELEKKISSCDTKVGEIVAALSYIDRKMEELSERNKPATGELDKDLFSGPVQKRAENRINIAPLQDGSFDITTTHPVNVIDLSAKEDLSD